MKNKLFIKKLLVLLVVLITCIPQMRAWQAHGTFNSWGNATMTQSSANSAVYYYAVSGTGISFKVTGDSGWGDHEMGSTYINNDLGNITLSGSGNISGGVTGTWYICYHATDDKVYATTTNPNYPDMVIAGSNFGSPAIGDWSTTATVMTNNGSGTYTKTITNVGTSNCQFKIAYKGTWTGAKGYDSKKVSGTNCSSGPSDASGNISFTPAVAGSVTITYVQSTGAITIACPKFSVTYDGNGKTNGSVPTDASSPYNSGSTVTVLGNTGSLEKTGFHFAGWNSNADGTGTDYAASSTFSISSNTTLYAKWVKTIYVYDDASFSTLYLYTWSSTSLGDWPGKGTSTNYVNSLGSNWYEVNIPAGAGSFILNNNSDKQTNDLSNGTYTDGRSYHFVDGANSKKDLEEKQLTVSFNMKDHGDAVSDQSVYYNGLVTEPSPAPTADHYTFVGWYKETGCTNAWNFSTDRITAAKTLYAKWAEVKHDVRAHYGTGGSSVSPSSWTAMGEVTGGAVTATNATGYHFDGWTIDDSKGGSFADASSASTTFFPVANDTWITAHFAANTYDITLDKNSGDSDGSATATYLDDDLASFSAASRAGYTCDGYFDDPDAGEGNMIIDASGNLQLSKTGYTNATGWTKTSTPTTLYAHWTENVSNYTVTYAVKSDQTSLGTLSCATTVGGTSIGSGDEVAGGTGVTFTAAPISGYEVDAWCSNPACTSPIAGAGYANTYSTSVSADLGVYVKFKKKVYAITYSPSSAPTGCTYTTKPVNGTYGNTVTMVFTPSTGYTVSVSAVDASSNTVTISNPSTNTYTFTQPASAVTVTVTATEIKSTITVTANNTSAGSLKFGETSKTWGQTPSLGVATTQAMTATASSGYVFCNWVLSGAAASASDLTGATITLKADGSGNTGTATAKFYEDYYYRGDKNSWAGTSTDKLVPHTCGYYAYYKAATGAHNFKITPDASSYDYACNMFDNSYGDLTLTSVDDGFGGTNVRCAGDGGSGHFICMLYPNTAVNDLTTPIIFAIDGDDEGDLPNLAPETMYATTFSAGDHGVINVKGSEISTSASVNIGATLRPLIATPADGYSFDKWVTTGSVTVTDPYSESTTVSASAAGGTVTATYLANTGWYMHGVIDGTTDWCGESYWPHRWPIDRPYRGVSGVYYRRISSILKDGYFGIHDGTNKYSGDATGNNFVYDGSFNNLVVNTSKCFQAKSAFSNKWVVINTNGTKKIWIQDAETCHTVSVTNTGSHGTVVLKTNNHGNLTTNQYTNGETILVEIDTTVHYSIASVTLSWGVSSSSTVTMSHSSGTKYTGTVAMPNSDATLTVTYTPWYQVKLAASPAAAADAPTAAKTTGGATVAHNSYVLSGTSVTFTQDATPNDGYSFDHWENNSSSDGTGNTYVATISAATTVTAVYTEDDNTVAVVAGVGGTVAADNVTAHVSSKVTLPTATPSTGYYFTGWEVTEGDASLTSASSASEAQINGVTSNNTVTVRANFHADDKIYFDNTYTQWSKVYVYLFNNDVWYNEKSGDDGPGVKPNHSNRVAFAEMTKVAGEANLYEFAYHTSSVNYTFSHVAFSKDNQSTDNAFYNTEAAYRNDWDANLQVYVAPAGYTTPLVNGTKYHGDKDNNAGYWRVYNPKAGDNAYYYLDKFSGTATFSDGQYFKASGEGSLVAEVTARLTTASSDYTFGVHSVTAGDAKNLHFATSHTFTEDASEDIKLYKYNSSWNITLTTTSEGDYTFILSMEKDSLRLSVIYPPSVNDYRLKYTENGKSRYSDIIKKKTADAGAVTTSMYINKGGTSPSLVLEQCTAITDGEPEWTERKDLGVSSFGDAGVYVMDLTVSGTNGTTSTISNIAAYDGPYYIKTACAKGGWADYKKNELPQNTINFSTSDAKTFDYYMCAYVGSVGTNIKCVIANDYNNQISDTLKGDDIIGAGNQTMPYAGSVRFSYNSSTNELKRSYINGSGDWENYFLELQAGSAVIKARNGSTFTDNKVKFSDNGNWIYNLELKAQEGARIKLVSHYYNGTTTKDQYFKGSSGAFDSEHTEELIGFNGGSTWQDLTIIYDFKTNNLISAWSPSGDIDATINLKTDVLLIHNRQTGGAGDVVTMIDLTDSDGDGTYGDVKTVDKVYSAMRFQKTADASYIGMTGTPANSAESYYRYNYWISFPYEVKMTDIFGISGYGSKWRIQRYAGDKRAANGWYKGDGVSSFWETMPMSDDATLNKGEGYVLQLSPSAFQATGSGSLWELSDEVYLYFPSKAGFGDIERATSSVSLSSLPCTKGLFTDGSGKSHNITDSHWHLFGIPTFSDATGTKGTGTYYDGDDAEHEHGITNNTFYFYEYANTGNSSKYNVYTATSSSGYTFQPMHAYMIQMTGTLNFTENSVPASVAARQRKETKNYDLRVELKNNDMVCDHTFVTLRDSAVSEFALNEDLTKIHNSGKSNIYSYAGAYDVAANILPIESHTIALGVEAADNGYYTFTMPSNFDGEVTLVDRVAETRTNLAMSDYEVYLEKGEINDRFLLEINIKKVATAIDGGGSFKDGKAHKFIENGVLYILRDGKVYDATGNLVK